MSPSHAMSPRAVSGGDPHRVFGMLEPKRCTPVRLILGRTFEDEAGEDVHPELAVPEHRFSRRACHFRVAALWGFEREPEPPAGALRRDPWRAATPSQKHSSRRKTPLVLPRTRSRENKRDRGSLNLRNQVLFLAGGRRSSSGRSSSGRSSSGERPRGSSGAGILRFPHRWTDPRCRESIVLRPVSAHNPSGKQEQTRTDDPRATPGAEPVPERVPGSAAFSVRFLAG